METETEAEKLETETGGAKERATSRWRLALRSSVGLLFAVISALFFASMALMAEISSPHINNVLLLLCVRFAVQGLLSVLGYYLISFPRRQQEHGRKQTGFWGPPPLRGWLAARALMGGISTSTFFFSLSQLPLGDAVAIYSTVPLFAAVLARVFLGESFHWINWIAGAMTVVGVLIMARPAFLSRVLDPLGLPPSSLDKTDSPLVSRPAGAAIVVFASLCSAGGLMIIRKIREVPTATLVFAMSGLTFFVCAIVMVSWERARPTLADLQKVPLLMGWGAALLAGSFGSFAQLFMTLSLKVEKTGPATFAMTLDTFFAFCLQAAILGTPLGPGSLVGSALTVFAVSLLFAVKLWIAPSVSSSSSSSSSSLPSPFSHSSTAEEPKGAEGSSSLREGGGGGGGGGGGTELSPSPSPTPSPNEGLTRDSSFCLSSKERFKESDEEPNGTLVAV
uniref:EamA domain-containing protein n=1 Tax=Chromera velia CCMP2878 TaxID=1169474 RepID=A0A0G4HMB2_9ALVE|eukprot:Cvel_7472.t1-p1 / transcript=Cvel_7472.t1 / gene=Cvel_7472 / organism=Chromera_velia_CCMP2878 / gene_product=Probable transport protein YPL264C, putative / transcript_product=Probable transport protein YPL264C, putative / location=Cvel_scaffold391:25766-28468(-) / protein_length=449 / sequence_SO=supercontig / SO=protein_coding / is_pseudo=false